MSGWNDMVTLQQVLCVLAIATTVFLLIQIIMLFAGKDADGATDGATDAGDTIKDQWVEGSAKINFLSVRAILVFIGIFAWVAFALMYVFVWYFAMIIAAVVGIAASIGYSYAMYAPGKSQNNGALEAKDTVDKLGEVSVTVPPSRSAAGKVNVYVRGRAAEFDAVTDYSLPIEKGSQVKIRKTTDRGALVVEPLITGGQSDRKE